MVSSGKQIGDARGGLAGRGVLPLALLAVVAGGPARAPANAWGADAPDVLPEVLLGHSPVSDAALAASAPGVSPRQTSAAGALAFPWAVLIADGTSPVFGVRTLVLTSGAGAELEAPPWPERRP